LPLPRQVLPIGVYTDSIQFTSGGKTTNIPVVLSVRAPGEVLRLSTGGVTFETRQGNGDSFQQDITVINGGDPGTTVNFTATLLSGSDWLNLTVGKNQATTTSPGYLLLQPNASIATFPAGARTAVLQVSDPNSQNSPQLLTAVLQVDGATTLAPPNPSPTGVLFVATNANPTQVSTIVLNYSSSTPAVYQAGVNNPGGSNWLTITPASGQVSTAAPASLTLSASATGLKAGIYSGSVNISIGSILRTIHATLIVPSGVSAVANPLISGLSARAATGCTPQNLVLVETALADNFSVLAGFPALLTAQLDDDCGNPVLDASVVASFSNGDAPLRLDSDHATGFYNAS
jgi:hypothetical protein